MTTETSPEQPSGSTESPVNPETSATAATPKSPDAADTAETSESSDTAETSQSSESPEASGTPETAVVPAARKPQPRPRPGGGGTDDGTDGGRNGLAPAPSDADERGRLEISHAVVRKLAERVVDGTPGVTKQRRTLGSDRGTTVKVGGSGVSVDLVLDVALEYPRNVRDTVRRVRESLSEEIDRITGYRVRTVDVVVSRLRRDTSARIS